MKFNIWNDFPQKPLPELLDFIVDNRGKTVPTVSQEEACEIVLIATNCIRNENLYPVYEKVRYISKETYEKWFRAHPISGDIIFVNKGTPGRICFCPENIDFCIAQDMMAFRVNSSVLYNKYLLAVLRSREMQEQIRITSVGDTIPHFKKEFLKELTIPLPPMDVQQIIGDYYFKLSEKIELNKKINENLEQQAQALYRQMFVYADDNQSATIADISLNVTDGVHNTVKDDPDGSYLLLSCKNIKGGSLNIGSGERHINKETFDKLRKRTQLAKGDILISSVGTIGEILMLNTEPTYYEFQRSVAMIKPDTELVSPAYVYESLLYKKAELINAAHGAVQQCLFISDISEFPIDIPSKVKLDIFNSAVIPMFEIITANNEENQRLAALRDTLLPKLMNGEIDVSAVKI